MKWHHSQILQKYNLLSFDNLLKFSFIKTMAEIFTAMWTLSTSLSLIQADLVDIFCLSAGWFTLYVCDFV